MKIFPSLCCCCHPKEEERTPLLQEKSDTTYSASDRLSFYFDFGTIRKELISPLLPNISYPDVLEGLLAFFTNCENKSVPDRNLCLELKSLKIKCLKSLIAFFKFAGKQIPSSHLAEMLIFCRGLVWCSQVELSLAEAKSAFDPAFSTLMEDLEDFIQIKNDIATFQKLQKRLDLDLDLDMESSDDEEEIKERNLEQENIKKEINHMKTYMKDLLPKLYLVQERLQSS